MSHHGQKCVELNWMPYVCWCDVTVMPWCDEQVGLQEQPSWFKQSIRRTRRLNQQASYTKLGSHNYTCTTSCCQLK